MNGVSFCMMLLFNVLSSAVYAEEILLDCMQVVLTLMEHEPTQA
jgi:hypothetical protein